MQAPGRHDLKIKSGLEGDAPKAETMSQKERKKTASKASNLHTRKWYKENFGVDPVTLGLEFTVVPNPHFRSAPPMKLWSEEAVLPFKSEQGIEKFTARKNAGLKAAQTRKRNLADLFSYFKNNDPKVQGILKRLWEIHSEIGILHDKKARHRDRDSSRYYFEFGIGHCQQCDQWSENQDELRDERDKLFEEIEAICGMEKQSIQLARRYLREESE